MLSEKTLESPRRGTIGRSRHTRKSSASGASSQEENTSTGRVEGRRKSSRRRVVALRRRRCARTRILENHLNNLNLSDALDGLDDNGGLHDHDDRLRDD